MIRPAGTPHDTEAGLKGKSNVLPRMFSPAFSCCSVEALVGWPLQTVAQDKARDLFLDPAGQRAELLAVKERGSHNDRATPQNVRA